MIGKAGARVIRLQGDDHAYHGTPRLVLGLWAQLIVFGVQCEERSLASVVEFQSAGRQDFRPDRQVTDRFARLVGQRTRSPQFGDEFSIITLYVVRQ